MESNRVQFLTHFILKHDYEAVDLHLFTPYQLCVLLALNPIC